MIILTHRNPNIQKIGLMSTVITFVSVCHFRSLGHYWSAKHPLNGPSSHSVIFLFICFRACIICLSSVCTFWALAKSFLFSYWNKVTCVGSVAVFNSVFWMRSAYLNWPAIHLAGRSVFERSGDCCSTAREHSSNCLSPRIDIRFPMVNTFLP